jgi:para-nitrobenzyl esterase
MPGAEPLFNKASIESGPGIRMTQADQAAQLTERVLSELGIETRDWQRVLDVPVSRLLEVQVKLSGTPNDAALRGGNPGGGLPAMKFSPVVDGQALPTHSFDPVAPAISRNKPLMVGYNRDEAAFFAFVSGDTGMFNVDEAGLRERLKPMFADYEQVIATYQRSRPHASPADILIAVQSAGFAANGSVTIAERKVAQQAAPAFAYIFNYPLETVMPGAKRPLGPMHALEIPFKFNNIDMQMRGAVLAGKRPERYAAGRAMSEMWATFARTGAPGAAGQPHWPAYNLGRRPTMIIDAACRVADDPYGQERRFWQTRAKL